MTELILEISKIDSLEKAKQKLVGEDYHGNFL
jgi:hypothetical protein